MPVTAESESAPTEAQVTRAAAPHAVVRYGWMAGGWAALGLAGAGVVLPVVPTTPFVLVAAWCFSKGSRRMHQWLLDHQRFGPVVRDWERHGVIRMRGKVLSTAVMVPLMGYMAFFSDSPPWALALALPLALFGLGFVWSRPSRPPSEDPPGSLAV